MSSVEHSTARSHTPKLRASCDACAVSKVKCTKERPGQYPYICDRNLEQDLSPYLQLLIKNRVIVCSRCAKRGAICKYLVTKRQQNDNNAAVSDSPRPPVGQMEPASLSNVSPPNTPLSFDDILAIDAFNTATISTPTYSNIDLDNFLTGFVTDSLSSHADTQGQMVQTAGHDTNDLLSSSNDDIISLFTPKNSFPMVDDTMADMPALSQPSTPRASHTPSLSSGHRLDSSLSDPSCCCLRTALGFVQRLSPNSDAACIRLADHSTDETSRPLTIESVVRQNGEIIESIRSILQCPCSRDGYVLTTISLVVLKVMSWYAAVARGSPSPSASSSIAEVSHADTVHRSQSWPTSTNSKHILPFPATVGGYCIDGGKDSHRMAAQLVLSELHRVQALVNLFSERLKHDGDKTPVPESAGSSVTGDDLHSEIGKATDSPLPPGMSDQLEDNLRRRLRAIWQELVDMLQRE